MGEVAHGLARSTERYLDQSCTARIPVELVAELASGSTSRCLNSLVDVGLVQMVGRYNKRVHSKCSTANLRSDPSLSIVVLLKN